MLVVSTIFTLLLLLLIFGFHHNKKNKNKLSSPRISKAQVTDVESDVSLERDADSARLSRQISTLAFGVDRVCESNANLQVVNWIDIHHKQIVSNHPYFPRQPLVLPKLMKIIRKQESDVKELVNTITEDPGLTGEVLKMANSPRYRITIKPIVDINYAVILLGIEGLKAIVSTSLLKPIFDVTSNQFKNYPKLIWEYALEAALAAQTYSHKFCPEQSFNAHLVSLIHSIAQIVLFRYTSNAYRQFEGLVPNPATFMMVLDNKTEFVVTEIFRDWGLEGISSTSLKNEPENVSVHSALDKSVYIGHATGALISLCRHQELDIDTAYLKLRGLGLESDMVRELLIPASIKLG